MDITQPVCGNCKFSLRDGPNLLCRRYPPTVFMVQVQRHVVIGPMQEGPQSALQSAFPPMGHDGWCGEHQLKVEGSA